MRRPVLALTALVALACSTVGVAAQSEEVDPMAPAAVTGTDRIVSVVSGGTATTDGDFTLTDNVQFVNRWEASDPRLTGDVSYTGRWLMNEVGGVQVEANHRILVNDGGRWVGNSTAFMGPTIGNIDTVVLTGEEGYEGLMAYVSIDWGKDPATFVGVIIPAEMPAPPEPAAE